MALSVPSAVILLERNYLINPSHHDLGKIKISGPFDYQFDPRILEFVRH